jgi:RNA polymerase sigma-70 factor (ECF subfamily)
MRGLESELKPLMLRALQGDGASYQALLERLAILLRAYFRKKLNPAIASSERAEDLVQDVLLSIHHKKHLYSESLPLLPWVYAIARYRLIDAVRSEGARPQTVAWDDSYEDLFFQDPDVPSEFVTQEINELLQGLNDKQRQIFILAKVEELSLAEIAELHQMSVSAVKVTVHRAARLLRERALKGQPEGGRR